jgi:hypothetical protein
MRTNIPFSTRYSPHKSVDSNKSSSETGKKSEKKITLAGRGSCRPEKVKKVLQTSVPRTELFQANSHWNENSLRGAFPIKIDTITRRIKPQITPKAGLITEE